MLLPIWWWEERRCRAARFGIFEICFGVEKFARVPNHGRTIGMHNTTEIKQLDIFELSAAVEAAYKKGKEKIKRNQRMHMEETEKKD